MRLKPYHPLSQGLEMSLLLNENGGSILYDATGNQNHGTGTNIAWGRDGLDLPGANEHISIPNFIGQDDDWTIFVSFIQDVRKPSSQSNASHFMSMNNGSGVNGRSILFIDDQYGTPPPYKLGSNITGGWYIANTEIDVGKSYTAGLTQDGNSFHFYLNGKDDGSFNVAAESANGNIILFDHKEALGNGCFDGTAGVFHWYNRPLSAAEMAWLDMDQLGMFEPDFSPAAITEEAGTINTENKRRSAMSLPWDIIYPVPDGSINAADRRHLLGLYSGFGSEHVELMGVLDGTSSIGGGIAAIYKITASADGTTSIDGVLRPSRKITGTIDGVTTFDAGLSTTLIFSGSVDAISATTSVLKRMSSIDGTIPAVSTASAELNLLWKLAATVDSLAAVDGTLTIGNIETLAGIISSTSDSLAVLKRITHAIGATTASSDVSAILKLYLGMSGTIDGLSTTSGALTVGGLIDLIGVIPATSDVSSQIKVIRCIDGEIVGVSAADGILEVLIPLVGELGAASGITGDIDLVTELVGSIVSDAETSGDLIATYSIGGDINGETLVQGVLSVDLGVIVINTSIISLTTKRTIAH